MAKYTKFLILLNFIYSVALIILCLNINKIDHAFPTDKNGFPRHDIVMINGNLYDIDFSEKSMTINVTADTNDTVEIILPRYFLSCVWSTQYENAILQEYKRIEMNSNRSIIGISNFVDKYVFKISEVTNYIHFKSTNEMENGSSYLFQLNIQINQ